MSEAVTGERHGGGSGLSGAGILVTRPAHQTEELVARIEAQGGVARPFPLLAIEFLPEPERAEQALSALQAGDWLVAVSPNAVTALNRLLARGQLSLPELRYAAVGAATARALRDSGRGPDACPAEGEGAAALLKSDDFQALAGRRVALCRGPGGRRLLDEALPQRGAEVIDVPLYRRIKPPLDAARLRDWLDRDGLHLMMVTSVGAVDNLLPLLQDPDLAAVYRLPLVAPSERVLKQAAQEGFSGPLLVAAEASDRAMVETAVDWWQCNRTNS